MSDYIPDDRRLSLILSEALGEIGVTESIVKTRRRCTLLKESLDNIRSRFTENNITQFRFGSQSEACTTIGLDSDVDMVLCNRKARVIHDWADWKHGALNLLMVQDETTSPGYCLLQLLRKDLPQASTHVPGNMYIINDDKGRVLLKNTILHPVLAKRGLQVNGPAGTAAGSPGVKEMDNVAAFHCDTWPSEGTEWLDRRCISNWPSADIKRLAVSNGCLVVPVASKLNRLHDVEWRISTSVAERLVMFNLNMTQIGCYVMLKIIKNTFLKMNGQSVITSFMCKCTLLHCIENTPQYYWREDNLFPCVMKCICELRECVLRLNCPHYIIPTNNLMPKRINAEQQRHLLNVLDRLINFNFDIFLAIEIDDLGKRLQRKLTDVIAVQGIIRSSMDIEREIVANEHWNLGRLTINSFLFIISEYRNMGLQETAFNVINGVQRIRSQYHTFSDTEKEASQLLAPLLSSFIGSLQAADSVNKHHVVSPAALRWFTAGLESDIATSRLKLASAFYCAGDITRAELILRELELQFTDIVQPVCGCYTFEESPLSQQVIDQACINNGLCNRTIAYCVIFLPCEAPIIPQELQQDLFRFTQEDIQSRPVRQSKWMDAAVVDSLPYMYFLQYKVYKQLGHQQKQKNSLSNLLKTVINKPNLGHRETAWNLLGQCMYQENMAVYGRWCFERSLAVRPNHNAANILKARLHRD